MPQKEYIRDKRSPVPKHAGVSRVMSANKAKNTKPELVLRQALWQSGVRGYRLNWKKVPGRPDIAFPGRRVAVFVNGCFWHRCPTCNYTLPKHNTDFWREKFDRNVARDERKRTELQQLGWQVLVVWECQIKDELPQIVDKITELLAKTA